MRKQQMLLILSVSIIIVSASVIAFPVHDAYAAKFTLKNKASCEALGGVWSSPRICTISSTLLISAGDTLVVRSGIKLIVNSASQGIINEGTIKNEGSITATGAFGIINEGTIKNEGSITATGSFNGIINEGTIKNEEDICASSVNNTGTITGDPIVPC